MMRNSVIESEYNPYYKIYIDQSGSNTLIEGLKQNGERLVGCFEKIPQNKLLYRYAENKWTIKEILQHIIDTERVFAYRAMRIARQDQTPLPGFDQDDFVVNSMPNSRSWQNLIKEYKSVRLATVALFESFTDQMLTTVGMASDSKLSVRAAGFIILGHENHHYNIIKQRYI